MTLVDTWTKEELEQMAQQCMSMRSFAAMLGYKSTSCFKTIRNRCKELGISLDHFTGVAKDTTKRNPENIFIENSTASQAVLRRWYAKGNYTPYKCSICGLEPFWNGKELTLTLDHINGVNHDDRLENLRWVCPNCDRQLDTFCAKNANIETFYNYREHKQNFCIDCGEPISDGAKRCVACQGKSIRVTERPAAEELRQILLDNNGNFTKVSQMFGVTDNTIRKWCARYDMPTHTKDYKH